MIGVDLTSIGFITIAAWIILTSLGVLGAGLNLWGSWGDFLYVKKARIADDRVLFAKVALWLEASRLLAYVLLLVAGVLVAAVQFNPVPPPASLYVRGVILLTICILVAHTLLALWLRRKLNEREE